MSSIMELQLLSKKKKFEGLIHTTSKCALAYTHRIELPSVLFLCVFIWKGKLKIFFKKNAHSIIVFFFKFLPHTHPKIHYCLCGKL